MELGEIAKLVGGVLVGDPTRTVTGLCPAEDPRKDCLTFLRRVKVEAEAQLELLRTSQVAAIVTDKQDDKFNAKEFNLILVSDPLLAMVTVSPLFYPEPVLKPGISSLAVIDPSATVGKGATVFPLVWIGENVVIGEGVVLYPHVMIYPGVRIGARTVLHSNVVIRENCLVGSDCTIHNGTVIGADGFGYIPDAKMGLRKVPQVGNVAIGEHVEIGANTCVDRGTFGSTRISSGAKLDNLVQIGHNVQIGRDAIVCGTVKIGGSTRIGDGVVLGGGVAIADHLTIVDGVRVAGHSGVTGSLMEPGDYGGFPAVPGAAWRRQVASLGRLPEVIRKLRTILRSEKDS